ncbi:hypothetical protein GCM10011529_30740 [Polymorphobacter glacialis]|uniref:DUF2332 domain-containing protein n=1 Tax=Sandarakinorhabdus glacialis TaxID=1614636 RepID=A0A917ECC7_9SPHN|nr:DUF2332 domain-containing protein [Polymorphobacter glacialis]GGE21962.1 hypothetical protein GCM10011529_30740 [Polymorphobacter glacialis]
MALPPVIAAAFAKQAEFCRKLGAPLTAAVCEAAVLACDGTSDTGRALIAWPGEPMADALMMRFTGGCNALVRAGRAPELAALYPPAPMPDATDLAAALRTLLADPARDAQLAGWLTGPPQTNEVARSGVLMPGLMTITAATGLPVRLFELGCSAGLNLNLDRFGYDLGGLRTGDPASPVQLAPVWTGPLPHAAAVTVLSRRGTDINPLDVSDAVVRERLMAFVWPEQLERVARAEAAIALAQANLPPIDGADAADWVQAHVAPQAGSVAVVLHSIAYQYFPPATKAGIAAHLAAQPASADAPLAWLRFEMDDAAEAHLPTLRLTLWQGGPPTERLLARAHPHGTFLEWFA